MTNQEGSTQTTDISSPHRGLSYKHPVFLGVVWAAVGYILIPSESAAKDLALIGMFAVPVVYWKGEDLHDYISTNPICQQVIQSVQRIF